MKKSISSVVGVSVLALFLQGCGSFNTEDYLPDKKVEYKKSKQVGTNLELPPDLTNVRVGSELYVPNTTTGSGTATYSQFLGEKQISGRVRPVTANVLPDVENIELKREGQERWLVIQSPPQTVWPNVVNFWQQNGILLLEQDPTVGVMKTGWLENRADIESDVITNQIRKVFDGLYASATRDQYRIRLEAGDKPGSTELYLTHFGMEEQLTGETVTQSDRTVWVPRGNDPGLEAEMLRRLMIHLGVQEQRANTLVASKASSKRKRSQLVQNARGANLIISESFAKSWRLTGLALDRVGFAVEDRDRSRGIYYVRYNDPMADVEQDDGWLSKLKFWDSKAADEDARFQIQLVRQGSAESQVVVMNEQGTVLASDTAVRILKLIHEQIQ